MNIDEIIKEYEVNDEQGRALDIGENTALRAGAGSGKTRVLTKRFVRILLENPQIELSDIAAITFTRKAATEMKDRIRKELTSRMIKCNDKTEKKRLADLRMLITTANIDTIHGFCGKILSDNYAILGIDPAFKMIEEVDASMKLSEISEDIIDEYISKDENHEKIACVINGYSTSIFTGLMQNSLIDLYRMLREKGVPTSDLKAKTNKKALDMDNPAKMLEYIAAQLVFNIDVQYSGFKSKENLLDFNDLELLTLKLLQNQDVSRNYFTRYKYLLVDEFQDVNPLQKNILDRLTLDRGVIPNGKLFLVGDHKQSIYGFRGADYKVFEDACSQISKCGKVIQLSNCYRSTQNIINVVNGIFQHLLTPFERLNCPDSKKETGPKVELITWPKKVLTENKQVTRWEAVKKLLTDDTKIDEFKNALNDTYENTVSITKKDYQGDIIGGRINKLIDEGFEYKDVAILMRSRTSLKAIESALERKNIPFCVLGGLGFWDRQEIVDILSLYQSVFQPEDTLLLFSVLRSPIFGFSDDMILEVSHLLRNNQDKNLINILRKYEKTVGTDEGLIIKRTADIFEKILPLDGIENALELFKVILLQTGYSEILISLPQGEKKLRNLEKLINIVEDFENKGIYSARELLYYIEVLKDSSGMDGEAFLDNEDSDAVKILTIHASKGLEFPAVIIPDMDREIDGITKKIKPLFYITSDADIAAIGLDDELEVNREANPLYLQIYNEKLARELEDSRRVFYVAATRAQKFLAFVGQDKDVNVNEALESQNSFFKQLIWALNKEEMEEVIFIDGNSLIRSEPNISAYPPDFINDNLKYIDLILNNQNETSKKMLIPYSKASEGIISISMWMKYRDCPRNYYFACIAGLAPEKESCEIAENNDDANCNVSIDSASMGTLVHKLLEELEELNELDEKTVAGCLSQSAASIDTCINAADKEWLNELLQGFRKIETDRVDISKGTKLDSLKEFTFRVPIRENLYLIGVVDRIDIFEKDGKLSVVIIDYKTNKLLDFKDAEKKAKYYEKQLLAYAWSLSRIPFYKGQNIQVDEIVLYFLSLGEAFSIELTKERTDSCIKDLIEASHWLLGDKKIERYPCAKSDKCKWCDYKTLCR